MANLTETSTYDAGVYQIELTDPVIGGASGITNTPIKNLANRTKYLKDHVDIIESTHAPKASPALTGVPTAPTATVGNSTTQLATTAFVNAEITSDAAPIAHVGSTGAAHGAVSTTIDGFMSAADKVKLNGIAAGATVGAGTITSVTGTAPIVSSGGTAPAISISAATTSVAGSLSAVDKIKLDSIASGANTAFAAGTKIAFFQAAAPTGWTQDITINNCMLRAVNAAGGGSGGTDSPVLNDKTMVAHTHSFTGSALAAHTHAFTGSALAAHTHTFAGNALAVHTHTDSGHRHSGGVSAYTNPAGGGGSSAAGGTSNTGIGNAILSSVSAGTPSGSISSTDAGTPSGSIGSTAAGTPSGSISSTAAVSWTPKYIDMIICAKN
jgi:hypothetical protein